MSRLASAVIGLSIVLSFAAAEPAPAADGAAPAAARTTVSLPQGYRSWRHVKSMIIEPGHALAALVEGTHHVYANEQAMRGYAKRPFPDGAIIVFDLFATVKGDQAITDGPRKAVIVMQKDAKRFAATGGWGYEVFANGKPDAPQVRDGAREACHACHLAQKDRDFVFSDYRD
jgi:hypothetical protein